MRGPELATLNYGFRVGLALLLALVLGFASACVNNPSSKASSARQASPSPKVSTSPPKPGPEVAMPDGFPADFPIYPGAKLTAAAKFTSSSQTTFGMNWETPDATEKVQAFYVAKLNQGDWNFVLKDSSNIRFSGTFSRKSNPKSGGAIGAEGTSGVAKISVSLVS
jgi:hypothetical protein